MTVEEKLAIGMRPEDAAVKATRRHYRTCPVCKHPDQEEIREWYERGVFFTEIAKEFGISPKSPRDAGKIFRIHAQWHGWQRPDRKERVLEIAEEQAIRADYKGDDDKVQKALPNALKAVGIKVAMSGQEQEKSFWTKFWGESEMKPAQVVEVRKKEITAGEGDVDG
jgi:hypothetical protein